MKRLLLLVCLAAVRAKPSHHHHPLNDVYPVHPGVGAIYKGPNSETIIEGPDGSVITSEADGGVVAVGGEKVAVAHQTIANEAIAQEVLSRQAVSAYAQANFVSKTPVVVAAPPPVVFDAGDVAALDGPSGSILRHGEDAVISGPSSTTIKGGKHVFDIPSVEVAPVLVGVSTPGPILVDVPLRPRPVVVDAPHPVSPFVGSVPVLVDDAHLVGSTLGTGAILVGDSKVVLSTPGPILHSSAVSYQNDVVPQLPVPVFNGGGPIVVAPHGVSDHAREEAYLSAVQRVEYEKALAAKAERKSFEAAVHASKAYQKSLAAEAERKSLEASIQAAGVYEKALAVEAEKQSLEASNAYRSSLAAEAERRSLEASIRSSVGHGLALNPVVSQGGHVISGAVVSSTASPLVVSGTQPPVLVTSLAPVQETAGNLNSGVASANLLSSAVLRDAAGPIVSRPTAVLAPPVPAGLGQIVVQSKTVSASKESSHRSSSVQSSSSTGIVSGPIVLGGGHGYGVPGGPPPSLLHRGLPVHRGFVH